jgi:hypothetical protein
MDPYAFPADANFVPAQEPRRNIKYYVTNTEGLVLGEFYLEELAGMFANAYSKSVGLAVYIEENN